MDLTPLLQYAPWAVGVLILLGLFVFQRDEFDKIALSVFLAIEKELGSIDGQAKMAEAILRIINLLPGSLKTVITLIANFRGKTLEQFVAELAQAAYDEFRKVLPPVPA